MKTEVSVDPVLLTSVVPPASRITASSPGFLQMIRFHDALHLGSYESRKLSFLVIFASVQHEGTDFLFMKVI